jgi:hypothetical protein
MDSSESSFADDQEQLECQYFDELPSTAERRRPTAGHHVTRAGGGTEILLEMAAADAL